MAWIRMGGGGKPKPTAYTRYRFVTNSTSGSGPIMNFYVSIVDTKTGIETTIVNRTVRHSDARPYYNDDNLQFYYPNATWGVDLKKPFYTSIGGSEIQPRTISWNWSTSVTYDFYFSE